MMHRRRSAIFATLGLVALALAACAPEPTDPAPSNSSSPASPSQTAESTATPEPTSTPTAGADADDTIALPAGCEQIYSAEMLASLTATVPPLNDPGVTLLSTRNAELLEILSSGIPTLRCSWGAPSDYGLATNVSLVDAGQSAAVLAALAAAGFGCADQNGGKICRIEQKMLTQDDVEATIGETHYVRGNGWVSTAWVNFDDEGYTEDIVDTLWG